jgi:GPH family glycoside/pentoside/hexuronide:cation symporter
MVAMALAIATFSVVLTLQAGDVGLFAAICFMSGAVIGADFAILPALFARRMADIAPEAGAAFGLWAFVQKAALALAAATMLPALDAVGIFRGGGPGKLGRGVAIADMALCFGALHPETRSDGAAGDHALPAPQPATA